jgi:hypothetical protein
MRIHRGQSDYWLKITARVRRQAEAALDLAESTPARSRAAARRRRQAQGQAAGSGGEMTMGDGSA